MTSRFEYDDHTYASGGVTAPTVTRMERLTEIGVFLMIMAGIGMSVTLMLWITSLLIRGIAALGG